MRTEISAAAVAVAAEDRDFDGAAARTTELHSSCSSSSIFRLCLDGPLRSKKRERK